MREHAAYRCYSPTYRPDLTILFGEEGSHHTIADLKFFDPLASKLQHILRAGARVAFGNTRSQARTIVLGRAERDAGSDTHFDPSKGEGHVAPRTADYEGALLQGHRVIPLLFETFGGFSPEAVKFLVALKDHVGNKLSSYQYEQTTWSARSWMSFQCQKISVALHMAAALEIAVDFGHAGACASAGLADV